jgi:hypothetical protein
MLGAGKGLSGAESMGQEQVEVRILAQRATSQIRGFTFSISMTILFTTHMFSAVLHVMKIAGALTH